MRPDHLGTVARRAGGQPANFGFLNPLLYSLAGTRAYHDILPVSPSDPQVDRALHATGDTHINNKFAPGFLLGINDAVAQRLGIQEERCVSNIGLMGNTAAASMTLAMAMGGEVATCFGRHRVC